MQNRLFKGSESGCATFNFVNKEKRNIEFARFFKSTESSLCRRIIAQQLSSGTYDGVRRCGLPLCVTLFDKQAIVGYSVATEAGARDSPSRFRHQKNTECFWAIRNTEKRGKSLKHQQNCHPSRSYICSFLNCFCEYFGVFSVFSCFFRCFK